MALQANEHKPVPKADDIEGMKTAFMKDSSHLEIEAEGHHTWKIRNYRSLAMSEHGPAFNVANVPWRILLWPRGNRTEGYVSCYLGPAFTDAPPHDWHCCVQFVIVMWNEQDPSNFIQKSATHRFDIRPGNWGFAKFADLREVFEPYNDDTRHRTLVEGEAVNISAYIRVYKDPTGVLWHDFKSYDSKKETGMVGIKNLGATSYLTTLLQSLFFLRTFRKAILQIPTADQNRSGETDIAWALQRLFHRLETSETAVSLEELARAFAWTSKDHFKAEDIYETFSTLTYQLETRMKGTAVEGAIPKIFSGKEKTYVSGIDVRYEYSETEPFWSTSLSVNGLRNLDESLKDYTKAEVLDGDMKWYTEDHGLQRCNRGILFQSLPPVWYMQLRRYIYSFRLNSLMKIHDRFEFPEIFDASPFLAEDADRTESYTYRLYGVLGHVGDPDTGYNYAHLRTKINGDFYKFLDDRVTRATLKEAIDGNFGRTMDRGLASKTPNSRSQPIGRDTLEDPGEAYMLVYIRQSHLSQVLEELPAQSAPTYTISKLTEEMEEWQIVEKS